MDQVDDSGIDSDVKTSNSPTEQNKLMEVDIKDIERIDSQSDLKAQIEKQREVLNRMEKNKKKNMLSYHRLMVPEKPAGGVGGPGAPDEQKPLVLIDSESEDEFATPRLSPAAHREITAQLIRDGYNLDLQPDDDDLDLIPPRPLHQRRCAACNVCANCSVQ